MFYYELDITYDGTEYFGLQDLVHLKTVQQTLNYKLAEILNGKISTKISSRTDKGVHALSVFIKLTSEIEFNQQHLSKFNNELVDIKINSFKEVTFEYNPIIKSKKEYRYYFTNEKIDPGFKFIANISNELDFEKIQKCLNLILGQHDFKNFYSKGSNVKSTEREIFEISLEQVFFEEVFKDSNLFKMSHYPSQCFEFKIIGNGFLKQMIRHLISALWCVGSGKLSILEFKELLNGMDNQKRRWKVASGRGLFLFRTQISDQMTFSN